MTNIRATLVLATGINDAFTHDYVELIQPTFKLFDAHHASNYLATSNDVAVYQTKSFRTEKKIAGTEAYEIYSDLVRRRVIPADFEVEFIQVNSIFLPCTEATLTAFNECDITMPPYRIHIRFSELKIFTRKGVVYRIVNGCDMSSVETI